MMDHQGVIDSMSTFSQIFVYGIEGLCYLIWTYCSEILFQEYRSISENAADFKTKSRWTM